MKKVLTVAGSDSSCGAGVQADLKTFGAFGVYGLCAVTAVTAQNTTGVKEVYALSREAVYGQIKAVFDDLRPDAVKIGMLGTSGAAEAAADALEEFKAENVVLDPVMVSSSGKPLLDAGAREVMLKRLLPLCALVTPNNPEASELSGIKIATVEDMRAAAKAIISRYGAAAVLVKGGHACGDATDVLFDGREFNIFTRKRLEGRSVHGTGCVLSSAIAANIALGRGLCDAVDQAKAYVAKAMERAVSLGRGSLLIDHVKGEDGDV